MPEGVLHVVPGLGESAGQALGLPHGRRHDRLHRLDRGRQAVPAVRRRVEHEARLARVRRQEPADRHGRLPRPRPAAATRGRLGHLLQPGRGLQRGLAAARRTSRSRTSSSSCVARAPRATSSRATRSTRTRRMGAMVDQTQTARAGLHRDRPHGGRQAHPRRQPRAHRHRRLLHRADRLRPRAQRHDDRPRGDLRAGALDDRGRRRGEAITIANDTIYGLAAGGLDRDVDARAPPGARDPGRRRLGQHLRRGRHHRARSAATSSRASAATSRSTRSRSTPSSRRSGSAFAPDRRYPPRSIRLAAGWSYWSVTRAGRPPGGDDRVAARPGGSRVGDRRGGDRQDRARELRDRRSSTGGACSGARATR